MSIQYAPPPYPRFQISDAHKVIAWIVAVLSGLYMLPWAIAATRDRPDTISTAWINFLLGWTVIGWIWALVRAVSNK